jgi:SAM-dependent methyltransferase
VASAEVDLPDRVLALLACPECRAPLDRAGAGLACRGAASHRFEAENGLPTFARPPQGKYGADYAARYAALWAYGHQTLHRGSDEPLYRTVSSLVAEALAARLAAGSPETAPPVIVDAGCGVGRVAADCAALAPAGEVIAIDGSPAMLELAGKIVLGREPVEVPLPADGFPSLTIPPRGAVNVRLLRADLEALPVADAVADLALCVNTVDRLPHGPDRALAECARILRPGGRVIFTNPMNWIDPELWRRYPDSGAVLRCFEQAGFNVETWFDDLPYREVMDARGAFEEFRTLVVVGKLL